MSRATGKLQILLNWSVERKVLIMLFGGIVLFPLVLLFMLHAYDSRVVINFMVGFLVLSIIVQVPLAKWISHVIALRSIKELNAYCELLKQGDYAQIELPPGNKGGHDFMMLKRNMHWMGYAIASRERKLSSAMTRLALAQQQIVESIDYASLIQTSFLPDISELSKVMPKHFLLWSQRDRVGGDSYWVKRLESGFFIGIIDCTGHGVPGAFMTLIVHSLLEKAVVDCSGSPAEILGRMNRLIKDALGQNEKGAISDDGMDCTLCHVDLDVNKLIFAGANSPLYVVDKEEVRVIKGDRCGLGYVRSSRDFHFTDLEIELKKGDRFYMATDGIVDQIGGEKRLPFGKSRLICFAKENCQTPIHGQGEVLQHLLQEYQGDEVRRDDVTVLGFDV